jgi:hypothetical protein
MLLKEHYEQARSATSRAPEEYRVYLRLLVSDCAALVSDLRGLSVSMDPQDRRILRNSLMALLADLVEGALDGTGLTHHEAAPIVSSHLERVVAEMGKHLYHEHGPMGEESIGVLAQT